MGGAKKIRTRGKHYALRREISCAKRRKVGRDTVGRSQPIFVVFLSFQETIHLASVREYLTVCVGVYRGRAAAQRKAVSLKVMSAMEIEGKTNHLPAELWAVSPFFFFLNPLFTPVVTMKLGIVSLRLLRHFVVYCYNIVLTFFRG